jgi:hypothetical protein
MSDGIEAPIYEWQDSSRNKKPVNLDEITIAIFKDMNLATGRCTLTYTYTTEGFKACLGQGGETQAAFNALHNSICSCHSGHCIWPYILGTGKPSGLEGR